MKLFDLSGRTALVTGGNRGLGRGMAEAMLEAGATVTILGQSASVFSAAQELSQAVGRQTEAIQAGLSNRAELQRAFAACLGKMGTLDILIVSHGIQRRAPAENFSIEACVGPGFSRRRLAGPLGSGQSKVCGQARHIAKSQRNLLSGCRYPAAILLFVG